MLSNRSVVSTEKGCTLLKPLSALTDPENRVYPTLPVDLYSMNGFEGQRVFIIPSRKAIIVRMGQTIIWNFDFENFVREILSTFPQDK